MSATPILATVATAMSLGLSLGPHPLPASTPHTAAASALGLQATGELRRLGTVEEVMDRGSASTGEVLVFAVRDRAGAEPWVSDGTPAGTHRLADLAPGGSASDSDPGEFVAFRGKVYFTADTPRYGREIWVTDGTRQGTRLVRDLAPGADDPGIGNLSVAGDRLYFAASTDGVTWDLWTSRGTAASTRQVADVTAPGERGAPGPVTELGGQAVFTVLSALTGSNTIITKPWTSDGTSAGTYRLDAYAPRTDLHIHLGAYVDVGGRAVFPGGDDRSGREVWATGTAPGSANGVKDIYPGSFSGTKEAVPVGKLALLVAATPAEGTELWVSDGTEGGTVLLRDLVPGPASSFPLGLVSTGPTVYFTLDSTNGLWATRGTAATTGPVDLPAGMDEPSTVGQVAGRATVVAERADGRLAIASTDGEISRLVAEVDLGDDPYAFDVGTVANTQVLALDSDDSPVTLWAWTAVPSTTRATPRRSYSPAQARQRRIRVPVRVAAPGARLDGGQVVLSIGPQIIGRARLVDGKAVVRITSRLRPGRTYGVRASWSGTVTAASSTSRPVSIVIGRHRSS